MKNMQGICYFVAMVLLLLSTNTSRAVNVVAAAATTTSTANHNCEEHNRNQTDCSGMMIGCCEWNENNNTCVSVDGRNEMSCNNTSDDTSNDTSKNTNTHDDDLCDESKCVAYIEQTDQYGSQLVLLNVSFSCYYGTNQDGIPNRMMCADGYVPQAVENGTGIYNDYLTYNDGDDAENFEQLHYFTCCPPPILLMPTDKPKQRHCSDPNISISDNNVTGCNGIQPYMRMMKNNTVSDSITGGKSIIESYICCDTIIDEYNNNGTTNFLNITECVPYFDAGYREAYALNSYASLRPLVCVEPEIDFDFQFPKYIDGSNYYECCKTQHKGTQSFVQDRSFYATLYPQIVLSSLAVLSCTILIIALLVPLVAHLKEPSRNNYSSYTLYLVYLAIPDLAFNFSILVMYSSYVNQVYNPYFTGIIITLKWKTSAANKIESTFFAGASTANLYLNSIIAYEIFILLRNNNQVVRHKPPSLRNVTLKAMVVYMFSIFVFAINMILEHVADEQKYIEYDFEKGNQTSLAILICNILVTYVIPIGFFFYVSIIIKIRNYLPSVTGREKELSLFFFRVVVCFCFFWIPGMCMVVIGTTFGLNDVIDNRGYYRIVYQIGLYFVSLQAIASTLMAMSKTDVRNYTKKLLSCSYVSCEADDMVDDEGDNIN